MPKGIIVAPSSFNDVCAVITTFRPDDGFPVRVQRIISQVKSIVIIDDSKSEENKCKLRSWFEELPNIIVQHNMENVGIAASLNKGISIARELGFKWILTLDDDSLIKPILVETLINAVKSIKLSKPIGIIGMSWTEANNGSESKNFSQKILFSEKRGIITSGSFFSIETYGKVGPFREEFFIDSVDYDFCLRARAKGYAVIKLSEIGFEHSLGCRKVFHIMGINFAVENHEAFRIYYGFRNSTILAFEHFINDPFYSIAVLVGNVNKIFKILFFERYKAKKLIQAIKGVKDSLTRKLGKRNSAK